ELSASLSHQWGQTDQDTSTVQVDASRERRENQGTTTSLSQMYNLLTGYHAGTNRASFLILARPHVLQPTDHRTFVHGLRIIEGLQDFFLIVTRPRDMDSFCIEAFLETGHFPEDVDIDVPEKKYETKTEDFDVQKTATNGWIAIASKPFSGFEVDGWEFDPNKGATGRGGVEEIKKYNENDDNAD